MTDKSRTPEADLAFMRSIVEGSGRPPMTLAVCYLAGGLLYGLQCLFHVGQVLGLIRWPDPANLAFVAFGRAHGGAHGQVIVFFVMTVAAAEVAVGLAIIVAIFRARSRINVDDLSLMRW